jgi:hypothetical protein
MIVHEPASLDNFLALCNRCETIQREVLQDILQTSVDTAFGRRFNFAAIHSAEQYREHIGTRDWNDIHPYARRLAGGESDQLFDGSPPYFICTSGTTGNIKIMPESERGRQAKSLTTRLRLEAMARHAPTMLQGKMLPLVNNAVEGYTEADIPYGSASGITLVTAPQAIQELVAFPMPVLDIGYCDALDYVIMRFAVEADVRAIFGNNAGRVEQLCRCAEENADRIIDDIENGTLQNKALLSRDVYAALQESLQPNPQRAGELREARKNSAGFLPDVYWPELKVLACWLSGSVGRYVSSVRPLFAEDVLFFDLGYGATEGKFNITLQPETTAGPLAIHAGFYEFSPSDDPDTFLMAHEVETNRDYELFITNYSGLYRYALHDIVQIKGFIGTTPQIVFKHKAGDILNLCGEKVAASSLIPLVEQAVKTNMVHWCVITDSIRKRYHFCIEPAENCTNPLATAREYAHRLELSLQEQTLIYPIFRGQNLLQPLTVSLMNRGWTEHLYAEHMKPGQSRAQVKLPLVYETMPLQKFELAHSS